MRLPWLAAACLLLAGAVSAQDAPEVTEDGLVRVPSNPRAGVYRAPDVPFAHYRRVIIGATIPIAFRKGWERSHREVTPEDIENIRADFARAFRSELERELTRRGGLTAAAESAPDVIRVDASVSDLDLAAPAPANAPPGRTFARSAGSMTVTVELRDAASGALIGRVITYEKTFEHPEPQPVSRVTNLAEFKTGFANAARYTREAINVAQTERSGP